MQIINGMTIVSTRLRVLNRNAHTKVCTKTMASNPNKKQYKSSVTVLPVAFSNLKTSPMETKADKKYTTKMPNPPINATR